MKKEYSLNEHTVSDACNSALVTLSLEHEPAAITRSSAPQALAPMRHLHSCLCPAADSSLSISRAPISATSNFCSGTQVHFEHARMEAP